jgi:hypothetical protein
MFYKAKSILATQEEFRQGNSTLPELHQKEWITL